tara:strand:+ start:6219 stop:6785 length:567 start_codon:yes stop_codon:yes gene_type:complete
MGVMKSLAEGGGSNARSGSIIEGDRKLLRTLKNMRETAARRVISRGAAKAAQVMAKSAKAEIPSKFKGAKKGIGWKNLKRSDAPDGGAKIGSKVGRTGKKAKADSARLRSKGRNGKKGVGIGSANTHWLFLGTKDRMTKKTRRNTGRFWAYTRPMQDIANSNRSAMFAAFKEGAWKQFEAEVKAGKAF